MEEGGTHLKPQHDESQGPTNKHGEERRGCRLRFLRRPAKSDNGCGDVPKDYHQDAKPMPLHKATHDRHQRREHEQARRLYWPRRSSLPGSASSSREGSIAPPVCVRGMLLTGCRDTQYRTSEHRATARTVRPGPRRKPVD